jgi:hypothetical protein
MTRYFTGSVSWVTDLAPYLPQYVAGHYEGKMTQVFATKFLQRNTWGSGKCVRINEDRLTKIAIITSAILWMSP